MVKGRMCGAVQNYPSPKKVFTVTGTRSTIAERICHATPSSLWETSCNILVIAAVQEVLMDTFSAHYKKRLACLAIGVKFDLYVIGILLDVQ